MRRSVIALCTATIVVGMLHAANAGQPTWTNTPTSGPSPNDTHTVSGTQCFGNQFRLEPQGIAINAGPPGANTATVTLFATNSVTELKSETFTGDSIGNWSGVFEIPAGLAAGTYPLRARCNGFENTPRTTAAGGFGAPVVLGGDPCIECFDYDPRSYTVLAVISAGPTGPADPVEGVVSFTG